MAIEIVDLPIKHGDFSIVMWLFTRGYHGAHGDLFRFFGQEKMHLVMNAGPGGVGDRYEGTATMMIEAAHCLLENEDAGRSSTCLERHFL